MSASENQWRRLGCIAGKTRLVIIHFSLTQYKVDKTATKLF